MIKILLVPYDGSPESEAAFNFALDLAKTYKSELHVLSVVRVPEPPTDVEAEAVIESSTEHFKKLFHELRKKAKASGIEIKTEVMPGHPTDQILHESEKVKADVIVMGHQTRSKFGRWLIGSTADRIVDHAQCTVIVVKKNHHEK